MARKKEKSAKTPENKHYIYVKEMLTLPVTEQLDRIRAYATEHGIALADVVTQDRWQETTELATLEAAVGNVPLIAVHPEVFCKPTEYAAFIKQRRVVTVNSAPQNNLFTFRETQARSTRTRNANRFRDERVEQGSNNLQSTRRKATSPSESLMKAVKQRWQELEATGAIS